MIYKSSDDLLKFKKFMVTANNDELKDQLFIINDKIQISRKVV